MSLSFNIDMIKNHPAFSLAEHIITVLRGKGFKAYLAGGCVRDALLNRTPKDLDIATDAVPDQVEQLFKKTVSTGKTFGVIRVIDQNEGVEVATFRSEKGYQDGRRPDSVEWSSEKEDALRRDFTVNALFYDWSNKKLIDHVDGVKDLENGILQTVGRPEERFNEDHLRILRALRFAFEFNLKFEIQTESAVKKNVSLVATVSKERIKEELQKILVGKNPLDALQAGADWGFWKVIFGSDSFLKELLSVRQLFLSESPYGKWSLFLYYLGAQDELLSKLTFSRDEQRFISAFFKYIKNKNDWFNASLGKILAEAKDSSFILFLKWLEAVSNSWAQNIFSELKSRGLDKSYPNPLINGNDLKSFGVTGPQLGVALETLFANQLENKWTSKEQALEWFRENKDA